MSGSNQELANTYQQQTAEEHVLKNPDTYTGSMEEAVYDTYLYDRESKRIKFKTAKIIPGLFKLFDEGIVNCRDHQVRMLHAMSAGKANIMPVTKIEISISDDGVITMTNDGNGIDVAKHPEHDLWIPEMIFGHLRTSTNYDKSKKKIVGGKNGFGFKLVLIWSEWGEIETIDHLRGLSYSQRFENNLSNIVKPTIKKCKKKPFTKVTFKPDYKRLGISNLSSDIKALFERRVYDVAAVTDKTVKVKFNDELIPVKQFQNYIDLYIGPKTETKRIYEAANERWEYAVALAPSEEFTHVSFVNGIYTAKGGKHVEYVLNQIIRKLVALIKKKKKVDVKASTIKEQLILFLRCDIENPGFDSQTKEYLTTPVPKFGSTCTVSDGFVDKIAKMGVMEAACALTEVKDNKAAKKTDGAKTKSIRGIPKLIDAHYAGTAKSNECTLLLCEGDSAKAGIVSGLTKEDRNNIGVYPMRGKLFNVRGETQKRILENKEINEIKKIIGLESGKTYTKETAAKSLRYGKILFMTDQDLDGSHIKGLGINLFDAQWGSLLELENFIGFMNTPILKAKKGATTLNFYNEGEWNVWKQNNDAKGWHVKYYKGLGTSTAKEFKEYFKEKKTVCFTEANKARDELDMVFNKKRAADRKLWLKDYDRELYLDTSESQVTYKDFLTKEMIHFSKYDNDRSIPNIMDGLKTSLRKILFTGFKRKLVKEIKVAQFSGSVSEISCYHHGEASLNGAIKGLCQDFVGSNNINLFEPKGQFGTRLQGGQDSASERYIHTNLTPITRKLFVESDDAILHYLKDDGTSVEPIYYLPIIPVILVNGCKGIGTGFSTDIPPYNPKTLIEYITCYLSKKTLPKLMPYYEGFNGTITLIDDTKFLIKGCYEILSNTQVRITELPIGIWTDDYKSYLEKLIDPGQDTKTKKKFKSSVKDYVDMSTDTNIDITITFAPGIISTLTSKQTEHGCNELEKYLKLYVTRTTTNMHVFDENEKLCKFDTAEEIADHYISIRLDAYSTRKNYLISKLEEEVLLASDKARFIVGVLDDTIDLRKKNKLEVRELMQKQKFTVINDDIDYKHLVRMPMDSVTNENVELLLKQRDEKQSILNKLKESTPKDMWIHDLQELETAYTHYKRQRTKKQEASMQTNTKLKVKKKKAVK